VRVGVKICGIRSAEAFDACIAASVDWIGFVFYPPSPRFVRPDQAAELSGRSMGGPRRVGLFVEPTNAQIADVLAELPLDILQIYSGAERVRNLRSHFGTSVWQAIGVKSPADLPTIAEEIDGFVLEAPAAPGTRPGGNGRGFDWAMLADWRPPAPWLLAGGLSPSNVVAAIHATGAKAVDVSSGVETAPGQKDPDLIAAFVAQVSNA
jgi:phosphoribosylanthranilate isomerase